LKIAIDELKLSSAFEPNRVPKDHSIQVTGLWLQGCSFDGKKMNDIRDTDSELI